MYITMKIYHQGNLAIKEHGEKICIFIEDIPLRPVASQIRAVDKLYSLNQKGRISKDTLDKSVIAIDQKCTVPIATRKTEKLTKSVVIKILTSAEVYLLAEGALTKGYYSIEKCPLVSGGYRLVGPNCIGKPRFNSNELCIDAEIAFKYNMIDETTFFNLIEESRLVPRQRVPNKEHVNRMVLGEVIGDCYYKKIPKKSRVHIN